MKLQFLILVAGAAVAAAAAVDPADIGLITGDERSPLEARFNACDRRCHNGKGHCDNKDQCKKKCHKCVDSGKAVCSLNFIRRRLFVLTMHSSTLPSAAAASRARRAMRALAARRAAATWTPTLPLPLATFRAAVTRAVRSATETKTVMEVDSKL